MRRGALLQDKHFRLLWSGHAISSFGDAMTSIALLLTAQRLTGSTAAVAATAIAIALPQLLVGLFAGAFVDRWSRRRVMISADVLRAGLVLGFLAVTTADRLWLLYVLAFAQAAIGTFFNPARAAMTADLVPADRLLAANSLSEMSRVVAGVIGVGAAGVLAGASSDLSLVFIVDAATFAMSAILIALIRESRPAPVKIAPAPLLSEVGTGLRLIFGSRVLVGVVAAGSFAMLGLGAVNVLMVPFVVEELGASEAWFGPLEAAQVAAMVTTGSLIVVFARWARPTTLISVGAIGLGAAVAAMAACVKAWQLMPLVFAAGWFVTPIQASVTTILQTAVPAQLRGRAQASLATVISASNLASMACAGLAAGAAGSRSVFVASGLIVVAAGFISAAAFRGQKTLSPAPAAALHPR
jgi:predicted MFS family arabinose efflux permease